MKLRTALASAIAVALLTPVAACSSSDSSSGASGSASPSATQTTLTVFAAASLTKSYDQIGQQFEKAHPGVTVKFSYAGSQSLVDQLDQGAPADVLATADTKTMDKAGKGSLVGPTKIYTSNLLTVITPPGNPGKVTGFNDSLSSVKLVICAPAVPCGNATKKLEKALDVTLRPVSEEQQVTDVRGKVESGEADAGIVYRTDAKVSGDKVDTIDIKGADKAVNLYPIAVTKNAKSPEVAQQFVDYVTSDAGKKVLTANGFTPAS